MTLFTRDELIDVIVRCLDPRPEILEAYLFGSRAGDHAGPLSDVDVAVYLGPAQSGVPGFGFGFGFAAELSTDLMARLPGSHVDIVVLNQASPLLYHRVLRDGIRILARRLRETTTREGAALSRFCDFVPQIEKIDAAQSRRIAEGRFGK